MNKSGDNDGEMLHVKRSEKKQNLSFDNKNGLERKLKSTKSAGATVGKREVVRNQVVGGG